MKIRSLPSTPSLKAGGVRAAYQVRSSFVFPQSLNPSIAYYFLLLFLLSVSACKKPTLDDTALIPDENLNLKFTDTLTVKAYTLREDFVAMNNTTNFCALGIMNDPDFGKTTAGFYLPFLLGTTNLSFDSAAVTLDSIVLYLRYYSVYGDWSVPQSVKVYEMTEGIVDSVDYYSNQSFAVNTAPVGEVTGFIPNMTDSVMVDGFNNPPLLKVMLDNSFGQKFIDASATSNLADDAAFRNFFKGLYIESDVEGKGVVLFDPFLLGGTAFSKLSLYFHDSRDSSRSYSFRANPASFVNNYQHDYAGSTVEPFINNPNTSAGDSLIFLQGLAGLNVKFEIPHAGSLGRILINKAELVVTKAGGQNDTSFSAPVKLTLYKADADGTFGAKALTLDQIFPASLFGGDMRNETDPSGTNTRYRFRLSRYYQDVSAGVADNGIYILPDSRQHFPNRLIAGGGSHSKYALKLNLTYTVIEE